MVLQVPPSYTEHAKEFPINPSNKVPERNSDRHNTDEDISRREFLKKAGMIAAGLIGAGAVGGGIGATIFGGKEKEPVATNPNVEPVTEPVEAETPAVVEIENETEVENEQSKEELIKLLEIRAGLNKDELANTLVVDRLGDWTNGGCNHDLEKKLNAKPGSQSGKEFASSIANANAEIFAEALFVDDWQQHADLVTAVDKLRSQNEGAIFGYLTTEWNQDPNITEGFKTWYAVDSATESVDEDGRRTLAINGIQYNNSNKNGMSPVEHPNFTFQVTFTEINGREKISATNYPHNLD